MMHHVHMIQYEHNTYIMYIYTVDIDVITLGLVCGYSSTLVRVTVLLYHEIEPNIFEDHLNIFRKYYSFITLNDLINHFVSGKSLPPNSLLITFDDGYKSNYHLISKLKKVQILI